MNEPLNSEESTDSSPPSKSQRKRDMEALRGVAQQLVKLSEELLGSVNNTDILEAVRQCKKISRGSARKRQIQHIAKLIQKHEATELIDLVATLDSSSRAHQLKFHALEKWRELLLSDDPATVNGVYEEITSAFPQTDRTQLRQLVRQAKAEQSRDKSPVHYRKLFQFLRSLTDTDY